MICVSNAVRDYVLKHYPRTDPTRLTVIPRGVDPEEFPFGYQPDVVVGDLDSIAAPVLADLQRRGVPIEAYPRDKDATDGQLAIERAIKVQPSESRRTNDRQK